MYGELHSVTDLMLWKNANLICSVMLVSFLMSFNIALILAFS